MGSREARMVAMRKTRVTMKRGDFLSNISRTIESTIDYYSLLQQSIYQSPPSAMVMLARNFINMTTLDCLSSPLGIYPEPPTAPRASNLSALKLLRRTVTRQDRIKIDITKTEYPLIRSVAVCDLGWKVWNREEPKDEVNLYWNDTYITEEYAKRLKYYQRLNHFPGSQELGRKNHLCTNLNAMRKCHPELYNFYPKTWNFPHDSESYSQFEKENPQKWYIVKPTANSQGRGIYIVKKVQASSTREEMVVQEYIESPLLIEGTKFDLRIYVLVKSLFPLKIFIYQEGLGRLATQNYSPPQADNLRSVKMHLTNYAINKTSSAYIFNKSEEEDGLGHKRSYSAIMSQISELGCDIDDLQKKIDNIIVKTILSAHPKLCESYKSTRDIKEEVSSVCFQIFGFDVMLDSSFTPYLLQVNHTPSFFTDSPLDMTVKKCLILDTLVLLNIPSDEKLIYLKKKGFESVGLSGDPFNQGFFQTLNKNILSSRQRTKLVVEQIYENEHLGGYRRIYPCQQQKQSHVQYETIMNRLLNPKSRSPKVVCISPALETERVSSRKESMHYSEEKECFSPKQKLTKRKSLTFTFYDVNENKITIGSNAKENLLRITNKQELPSREDQGRSQPNREIEAIKKHIFQEQKRQKALQAVKMQSIDITFLEQQNKKYLVNRQRQKKKESFREQYLNHTVFNPERTNCRFFIRGHQEVRHLQIKYLPSISADRRMEGVSLEVLKEREKTYEEELKKRIEKSQMNKLKLQKINLIKGKADAREQNSLRTGWLDLQSPMLDLKRLVQPKE